MKRNSIKKIVLLFSLMGSLSSVFAAPLSCPPANDIKNANLTQARPFAETEKELLWLFISSPFKHDDTAWNIWFGAILPSDSRDPTEVLNQGQAMLTKLNLISNPEPEIKDSLTICKYNADGDDFVMLAVTPPQELPSLLLSELNSIRK